jgi:hypothetical protein
MTLCGGVNVPRQLGKKSNLINLVAKSSIALPKSRSYEIAFVEIPRRNISRLATQTTTMPGPSNTLLIEGSFYELSEELAQYLDPLLKSEPGAGLEAEIEPALKEIREKEQAEEPSEPDALQKRKDEVLKKIVGKASVLNSAPEKGMGFPIYWGGRDINVDRRIHCRLQSLNLPIEPIAYSGHASSPNMSIPFRTASNILRPIWTIPRLDHPHHNIQHTAIRQ